MSGRPAGSISRTWPLQGLALKAGIDACITIPAGGHDFGFWKQAFSDSLPWLSWKLKLTPEPQSVPACCAAGKSSRDGGG
jgi:hypothetical protein